MLKLAFLCWLVATIAPGAALIRLLWPRAGVLRTIACAAPVSFGLLYAAGLASSRMSLAPASAVLWLSTLLVLAVLAIELYRHRLSLRAGLSLRAVRVGRPAPAVALSWVLLAGAVVLGVHQWRTFMATMLVPVGWDAMHHGLFTTQILRFHTMNPARILSSDVLGSRDGAKTFYPLAFNLVSAAIHSATGIPVSKVMLASTPAIAGVLMPVGVFALAREVDPRRHLVAGLSAIAATLPLLLYTIVTTGRVTGTLAVALVPGCALLLVAQRDRLNLRSGLLAVLALTGMLGLHTSEMPTAVLLAVALSSAVSLRERRIGQFWRWLVWLAIGGAVVAALAVLLEPNVLGLVTQRNNEIAQPVPQPASAALHSIEVSVARWFPLVIIGCLATLLPRWRAYLGTAVTLLLAGGIYFFIAEGVGGVWPTLAIPWYGEPGRMSWDLVVLAVIPAGIGLAAIADAVWFVASPFVRWVTSPVGPIGDRDEPRWRSAAVAWSAPVLGVLASLLLVVGVALPQVSSTGRLVSRIAGPVDNDSLAAYRFLAAHVGRDQHVLDDYRSDGSMWMYIDYGVAPLFGNSPLSGQHPPSWMEKLWLMQHIDTIDRDPCVRAVMAQYGVHYVYVGDRHLIDGWEDFSSARMERDPAFAEVFSAGGSHVFEVVGGATGRCDRNLPK